MLNISACIITDNNPAVLNAIESVYDSVSEIILVNTCEGDDKLNFDERLEKKIKFYYFKWNDSFSMRETSALNRQRGTGF